MTPITRPEAETADPRGPISTWLKGARDQLFFVVKPAGALPAAQPGAAAPAGAVGHNARQ
jgi:hypothetical protein